MAAGNENQPNVMCSVLMLCLNDKKPSCSNSGLTLAECIRSDLYIQYIGHDTAYIHVFTAPLKATCFRRIQYCIICFFSSTSPSLVLSRALVSSFNQSSKHRSATAVRKSQRDSRGWP